MLWELTNTDIIIYIYYTNPATMRGIISYYGFHLLLSAAKIPKSKLFRDSGESNRKGGSEIGLAGISPAIIQLPYTYLNRYKIYQSS